MRLCLSTRGAKSPAVCLFEVCRGPTNRTQIARGKSCRRQPLFSVEHPNASHSGPPPLNFGGAGFAGRIPNRLGGRCPAIEASSEHPPPPQPGVGLGGRPGPGVTATSLCQANPRLPPPACSAPTALAPPPVQSPPPHRLCPPGPTPRLPPPAPSPGLWDHATLAARGLTEPPHTLLAHLKVHQIRLWTVCAVLK